MQTVIDVLRFLLTAVCLLIGLFMLTSSLRGVFKFNYVINRMHSAAIGDTLGILFVLLGLIFSANSLWLVVKLGLIIVFFWIATPVAGHLVGMLEVNTNPMWEKDLERLQVKEEHHGDL